MNQQTIWLPEANRGIEILAEKTGREVKIGESPSPTDVDVEMMSEDEITKRLQDEVSANKLAVDRGNRKTRRAKKNR